MPLFKVRQMAGTIDEYVWDGVDARNVRNIVMRKMRGGLPPHRLHQRIFPHRHERFGPSGGLGEHARTRTFLLWGANCAGLFEAAGTLDALRRHSRREQRCNHIY